MKTNLDLAHECGADLMPNADAKRTLAVFDAVELDAFAERIRADERASGPLIKAAIGVLSDTEAGHRPPVRDRLECGRMAGVRVAALANLHDAVVAIKPEFGQRMTPQESARLHSALAEVFGWPKTPVQPQVEHQPKPNIHAGCEPIDGGLSTRSTPRERNAFFAWFPFAFCPENDAMALKAWEAATLAERERCALACKAISDKYAYGFYGNEVDTADECKDEIRKGRAMTAAPMAYQPKGSMCMDCQHLQRDCSGLPFHSMPGLWTHPGSVIVKCVEFVKRVP